MKSNFPKGVFIIIQIFFLLSVSQLAAQMPGRNPGQAAVTGWLDDSHYLFRTWDSEGKAIIQSVDIRTGKGTVISLPETSRDLLEKSLPEGTQPKPDDIVSPDNSGL